MTRTIATSRTCGWRTDPLDFLKYIPLGTRDDHYLSLGGTGRPRYEVYHNPDFGGGRADRHHNNDDLLQRYLLHGDLHIGPDLRIFGQIQSGFETGRLGGSRPEIDGDRFDVHRAFLDVASRWGEDESNSLTLGPVARRCPTARVISSTCARVRTSVARSTRRGCC